MAAWRPRILSRAAASWVSLSATSAWRVVILAPCSFSASRIGRASADGCRRPIRARLPAAALDDAAGKLQTHAAQSAGNQDRAFRGEGLACLLLPGGGASGEPAGERSVPVRETPLSSSQCVGFELRGERIEGGLRVRSLQGRLWCHRHSGCSRVMTLRRPHSGACGKPSISDATG